MPVREKRSACQPMNQRDPADSRRDTSWLPGRRDKQKRHKYELFVVVIIMIVLSHFFSPLSLSLRPPHPPTHPPNHPPTHTPEAFHCVARVQKVSQRAWEICLFMYIRSRANTNAQFPAGAARPIMRLSSRQIAMSRRLRGQPGRLECYE